MSSPECRCANTYANIACRTHGVHNSGMACTLAMLQAGARDISQYYQQVGRGGRDGRPSLCLCFLSAGDADGVRMSIKESIVSAAGATAVLRSIHRSRQATGSVVLFHLQDFEQCGIAQPQVKGVIANLTALGVLRRGPECASRFSVTPGTACNRDYCASVRPCVLHLWQEVILPQFCQSRAGGQPRARAYARDLCAHTPFLELGVVGPAEVFEALADVASEGLINADSVELTGQLYALEVLSSELLLRDVATGRRLKDMSEHLAKQQLDSIDEAVQFLEDDACVQRRLCQRFGAPGEEAVEWDCCGCSYCMSAERVRRLLQ